jgi:hypothetical protein
MAKKKPQLRRNAEADFERLVASGRRLSFEEPQVEQPEPPKESAGFLRSAADHALSVEKCYWRT